MNIKVWGESMAYIENVVIGTPIVDPKDMFVSDEDDWTRMEEEEIMESVSEKERDETEQEDRTNENSFLNVQMILMQSINMITQMEIGDTNSWD